MFGDAALGDTNLSMIATARSVGAAAKFTGSGGAVVALCPDGQQQEQRLQGELCGCNVALSLPGYAEVHCQGLQYESAWTSWLS